MAAGMLGGHALIACMPIFFHTTWKGLPDATIAAGRVDNCWILRGWVVEVVLCVAWSRHGNQLVCFLVTVDTCYGFPSRLHHPWLATWTALCPSSPSSLLTPHIFHYTRLQWTINWGTHVNCLLFPFIRTLLCFVFNVSSVCGKWLTSSTAV